MPSADNEISAARETVIEALERSAELYGLSRSGGRVYGVLYFADEPLSINELVDRTGYAKSTISNVTRRLTRVGLIRRRSGGESRRVHFGAEDDVWFILQDVYRQYVQREMDATRRSLDRAEQRLETADIDATDELAKIRSLRETYDELGQVMELTTQLSLEEVVAALEAYVEGSD